MLVVALIVLPLPLIGAVDYTKERAMRANLHRASVESYSSAELIYRPIQFTRRAKRLAMSGC